MKIQRRTTALASVLLLSMSGTALAQEKTCADVVWHDDVLARYPAAAEACRAVKHHDGRDYVQMNAIFHKRHNNGAITVSIEENDGDTERYSFMPQSEMRVWVDGEQKRWRDLYDRQAVRIYVPSDRFEFVSLDETEAPTQIAMVVDEPIPDPEPAALPKTASNRPLMMALGTLLLVIGGGIGAVRRFATKR